MNLYDSRGRATYLFVAGMKRNPGRGRMQPSLTDILKQPGIADILMHPDTVGILKATQE